MLILDWGNIVQFEFWFPSFRIFPGEVFNSSSGNRIKRRNSGRFSVQNRQT